MKLAKLLSKLAQITCWIDLAVAAPDGKAQAAGQI